MSRAEMQSGGSEAGRPEIIVRRFSELTADQLHSILALRSRVFVVEQACVYNDIDGRDSEPNTTHLWVEANGALAAYLRILDHTPSAEAIIGRVVTHPDHRGHGLAALLVEHAITRHEGSIRLEAQSHLESWYGNFEFVRSGAEYVEDGIPHVSMRRSHPIE